MWTYELERCCENIVSDARPDPEDRWPALELSDTYYESYDRANHISRRGSIALSYEELGDMIGLANETEVRSVINDNEHNLVEIIVSSPYLPIIPRLGEPPHIGYNDPRVSRP